MFEDCPCGSAKPYIACCGRLHNGAPAESAEALMRARYTAHAQGNTAYLLRSWAPETRPLSLDLDPTQTWTKLVIEAHEMTGPSTANVSFTAHWRQGGRKGRLSENSRFRRDPSDWVYIDGDVT